MKKEIYDYEKLTKAVSILEEVVKTTLTKEEVAESFDLIKWASRIL